MKHNLAPKGVSLVLRGLGALFLASAGAALFAAPIHKANVEERAALDLVRAQLKDGQTARFKDVKQLSKGGYCGWVNAKNSYGGYTGFAVFYVDGKKVILLPPDVSETGLC